MSYFLKEHGNVVFLDDQAFITKCGKEHKYQGLKVARASESDARTPKLRIPSLHAQRNNHRTSYFNPARGATHNRDILVSNS